MKYQWLLIAIAVAVVGFLAWSWALRGRHGHLGGGPAFLVSFPFMKHWMPKATFAYWATAAAISTVAGWLLYFGFARLGG